MRIIVYDPRGEIPDGELVEGQEEKLERAGIVSLPVEPDHCSRSPNHGYVRRGWGKGRRFNQGVGERGCPMLLYVVPDRPRIHFAMQLVAAGKEPRGRLRIATDSSYGALSAGLRADGPSAVVEIAEVMRRQTVAGEFDVKQMRWTIVGEVYLATASEGYLPLCLYGVCNDVAVIWTAATQTR